MLQRVALFAAAAAVVVIACSSSSSNTVDSPDAATLRAVTSDAGATSPPPTQPIVDSGDTHAEGIPGRCSGSPVMGGWVADGLCGGIVSFGPPGTRQLTFAPNGDLFAATADAVYLLRDNGSGLLNVESTWATTGGNTNNAHLDAASGYVYAGTADGVSRWKYDPTTTTAGPEEKVVAGQPSDGSHGKHTVHVYDGVLYVHSGSSGNASNETSRTDYDTLRSMIRRFDLAGYSGVPFAWTSGTPFTQGLRNANGFTRNETTKKLYAVVNGLDDQHYQGIDVHEDNPGEQVVELAQGRSYGYPFCFTAQRIVVGGNVVAPGTQLVNTGFDSGHDDAWCRASSLPPTTFLQAHSAPLDIAFFDQQPKGGLPERWRGGAFIALHGSWNRGTPTGFKVIWQPFNADGTAPMPTSTATGTTFPYEVVLGGYQPGGGDGGIGGGGPKDGPWYTWTMLGLGESPRPAGVVISPKDGALYIASDEGGFIYRLSIPR